PMPRGPLVTGGGRGIGRGIAERFAADGHTVIAAARSQPEVEATAQAICRAGGSAQGRTLDVTDPAAAEGLVREIITAHGRLDILANIAGTSYSAPLVLADPEQARAVLETNLLGAWIVSRAVLRPMMAARWGRIIHVGSISAEVGAPFATIYAASKGGVHALVRSLALELAHAGITVNAVAPGYVRTHLFHETQGRRAELKNVPREQHEADLLAEVPTGRLVEDHHQVAMDLHPRGHRPLGALQATQLHVRIETHDPFQVELCREHFAHQLANLPPAELGLVELHEQGHRGRKIELEDRVGVGAPQRALEVRPQRDSGHGKVLYPACHDVLKQGTVALAHHRNLAHWLL